MKEVRKRRIGLVVGPYDANSHDLKVFSKRRELMRGFLSIDPQKRLVKAVIWSVALCGWATWSFHCVSRVDSRRLRSECRKG
jgi:hypothetical protein